MPHTDATAAARFLCKSLGISAPKRIPRSFFLPVPRCSNAAMPGKRRGKTRMRAAITPGHNLREAREPAGELSEHYKIKRQTSKLQADAGRTGGLLPSPGGRAPPRLGTPFFSSSSKAAFSSLP